MAGLMAFLPVLILHHAKLILTRDCNPEKSYFILLTFNKHPIQFVSIEDGRTN
mgnify:CR=1 FL=1